MDNRKKLTQKEITIAKKVKELRQERKLTQEKLAERTHLSTTHIGMVEIGKRRMSMKTLQKIANVLGVKVKDLIPF